MTDPDDPAATSVESLWDDMLADLAATAEEYREAGWEPLELHPGDVTALSGQYGDRVGLDVMIPDDEFRAVEAWFDEGFAVDGYEVYRSALLGAVFLLVVVRDEDAERALLFPAYYGLDDERALDLFEDARAAGRLHTYLRRISGDYVELRHDDPDLFAPPEEFDRPASTETPDLDALTEADLLEAAGGDPGDEGGDPGDGDGTGDPGGDDGSPAG